MKVYRGHLRVTNHVEDRFITLSLPVRRERNGSRKLLRSIGAPAGRHAVCHSAAFPAPASAAAPLSLGAKAGHWPALPFQAPPPSFIPARWEELLPEAQQGARGSSAHKRFPVPPV